MCGSHQKTHKGERGRTRGGSLVYKICGRPWRARFGEQSAALILLLHTLTDRLSGMPRQSLTGSRLCYEAGIAHRKFTRETRLPRRLGRNSKHVLQAHSWPTRVETAAKSSRQLSSGASVSSSQAWINAIARQDRRASRDRTVLIQLSIWLA
jgi:hypothetical protein